MVNPLKILFIVSLIKIILFHLFAQTSEHQAPLIGLNDAVGVGADNLQERMKRAVAH